MAGISSDRERRIERLCVDALTFDLADRAEFLREACDGDELLMREVEGLLAREQSGILGGRAVLTESQPDRQQPGNVHGETPRSAGSLPIWVCAVIAVAVVRIVVALALYFSAPLPVLPRAELTPAILPPWWIYAALSSTFMALGLGLVVATRRDARAAWLGGVLVLAAVPFATPLLRAAAPGWWLFNLRPEAFSGALLWHFVARFPTEFKSRTASTLVRLSAAAAALIGAWCAAASLAVVWVPASIGWPWLASFANAPGSLYWPAILGCTAPTFPVLFWRAATAHGEARRRTKVFVLGLLAGFAPFTLEVLVEETVPAYKAWAYGPSVAPWIGAVIFGFLAVVPFVTTYSVLFDRVVDVRVVLRAAAQYILARYTILTVTLVPFAALAIFVSQHRAEPIVSLISGVRPLLLGTVIGIGLLSFRLRSRWLDLLDRRYFRESYDAHEILERVMGELQGSSAEQLARGLRQEIGRALHADAHVFLADDARMALRHVDGQLPAIALGSKLADLALADPRPMALDWDHPQSLLLRLPEEEQRWLRAGNFCLIVALRRASGGLEGLLALTPKRSGLPLSDDDRRLLSSIASAATLAFDSLRLRTTPVTPIDRPARECLDCGRVSSLDTQRCECGGNLAVVNVPHVLRGVFRFKQRIGAGGMGVVYRAVDLTLGREVAIKALPRITPELVARLRREARAMAAVTHPNLAVIHGVETWQGMPFLVQEYLAGGTLAQRLTAARPTLDEALNLGVTLAATLQHMHAGGVIHCDIKPSNIGFTQQGIVKLLDFGLARVMRDVRVRTAAGDEDTAVGSADLRAESEGGWFGTPQFMSPEAACGEPPTPLFDLWALAVVLYEAIAGCRPFDAHDGWAILTKIRTESAPDIRDARPDVPADVAAFFEAALASDISRRPPDAASFAASLRRLRNG